MLMEKRKVNNALGQYKRKIYRKLGCY